MAGQSIERPGVRVLQERRTASPTIATPRLKACIVGPAYEIVDAYDSGEVNEDAQYALCSYEQEQMDVDRDDFPSPRGNIAEVEIINAETKVHFGRGDTLERKRTGEAFLKSHNYATKAYVRGFDIANATIDAIVGKTFIFNVDVPDAPGTSDKTCTFAAAVAGEASLTLAQVVTQINAVAGFAFCSLVDGNAEKVLLKFTSEYYGERSSVYIRGTGTANVSLGFADALVSSDGAGFYCEDDGDSDNYGSWIGWSRGVVSAVGDDIGEVCVVAGGGAVQINGNDLPKADFSGLFHRADINFLTDLALLAEDEIYADGARIGDELKTVEASRIRLGRINGALSTYDSETEVYADKVVDAYEILHRVAPTPWSPKYCYFRAKNLTYPADAASTKSLNAFAMAANAAVAAALVGVQVTIIGDPPGPFTIAAGDIKMRFTLSGTSHDKTISLTETVSEASAQDAVDQLLAKLNTAGNLDFTGDTVADLAPWTQDVLKLVAATVEKSDDVSISILAGTDSQFGFDGIIGEIYTGKDVNWEGIAGLTMRLTVDDSPKTYDVVFSTDSALDIPAAFAVGCPAVVATVVLSGADYKLQIESKTQGANSSVTVASGLADNDALLAILGAFSEIIAGAGRPNPDVAVQEDSDIDLQRCIIRHPTTGVPEAAGTAPIYIQYRGLRRDVSALAANSPALIDIEDTTTLETVLGPLSTRNPLALAAQFALLNSPTRSVCLLGIDARTANRPMGTLAAHTRAAEFLEAKEVYAVAPLTQQPDILQMWDTHCTQCSAPDQKHERILLASLEFPDRYVSVTVNSGSNCDVTQVANIVALETNINQDLLDAGIDPTQDPIPVSDAVYLQIEVVGETRHYSLKKVNGTNLTLRVAFANGENTDGFYSIDTLPAGSEEDLDWVVYIRGDRLLLPGTTLLDLANIALTGAAQGEAYSNRRTFLAFGDRVNASVAGVEQELELHYYMAAIAGQIGQQPPQQGFTNLPTVGFLGVSGTNDLFSESRLNITAGGGRWLPIQEVPGGPLTCRHQLSTKYTPMEERELTFAKVPDYVAKFLRQGMRAFVGTHNITKQLLAQAAALLQGMLSFLESSKVLLGYTINNLGQSTVQPDKLLVDITILVPPPCNYIQIVLVI